VREFVCAKKNPKPKSGSIYKYLIGRSLNCPTCAFQPGQMHDDCPGCGDQVGQFKSLIWNHLQSTARVEARISPSESVRCPFRWQNMHLATFWCTMAHHTLCERRKQPSSRAVLYKCLSLKSLNCPSCVFKPGQSPPNCPGCEDQVGQFKSLFWKELYLLPELQFAFFRTV
jgi:hypothetical protein